MRVDIRSTNNITIRINILWHPVEQLLGLLAIELIIHCRNSAEMLCE